MAITSNTIQFRRVQRRRDAIGGGYYWEYVTQVRTKDTIIGVLGVSLGAWSDWQDIENDPWLPMDENGSTVPT